ncbi:alpha/beta hydrolase [Microbacterium sp. BWR-S6Y]|uniref:alpha/beta hydrolase n=1 Tax=Microbacterium sp. BWR-S6Y TaxID=3232073 RepID=UPI0035279A52
MSSLSSASVPEEIVPGSVEAAYEVSHLAERRAKVTAEVVERVRWQADIEGWTGEGADAYTARMEAVAKRWLEIGQGVTMIVEPMRTYALALRRAQGLAAAAIEAWSFAATLPEDATATAGAFASFAQGWPAFIADPRHQGPVPPRAEEARARAEAMLADARADVVAAGEIAAQAVRAAIEKVRARGDVWASVGVGLGLVSVTAERVLDVLQSLDEGSLTALLRARPDLIERLKQTASEVVAPWWRRLSPAQQNVLIAEAPGVVGNLGGVAYAARDRANRIVLAQALAEARNSPWDQSEQVRALEALERAAAGNTIASLVLDRPPLAQVAVGDLDAAEHVSVIVPGMGTTVGGDIKNYVRAADALIAEQKKLTDTTRESLAAVAWIGYHPPMPTVAAGEVLLDDRARAGAENLAHDIDALQQMRQAASAPLDLSIVAHSYGTDVATLGLEIARADHLVLLGSAGVADEVEHVSDLNVPPCQVFASQAVHDEWAPIGQLLSGREDPTSPDFGARVFSSEAAETEGLILETVRRHGPLGSVENGDASYFTNNTTALHNTALATMGQDERLVMGGTSSERAAMGGSKWAIRPS